MANDKGKIKISVTIDETESNVTKTWISSLVKEVDTLEKKAAEATDAQIARQKNLSTAIKGSLEQYEFEDEKLTRLLELARQKGQGEAVMGILMKKGYQEGIAEVERMIGVRQKESALTKEQIKLIQHRATELRHESIALRRISADIQLFSQAALVTGTAGIGAAVLIAKQYADNMEKATEASAKFVASQNRLTVARNRMGEVFARELVPFIEQATKVMDRAGQFIRANPQIVSAAVKGAEILVGLGVLGKTVAVVTRLTADVLAIQSSIMRLIASRAESVLVADKQVAAGSSMLTAAEQQLLAAHEMQNAAGQQVAASTGQTAGGVIGRTTIGTVGALAGGALALGAMNFQISKQLEKLEEMVPRKFQNIVLLVEKVFNAIPGLQLVGPFRDLERALKRDIPLIKDLIDKIRGVETADGRMRTRMEPAMRVNAADFIPTVATSEHLEELIKLYEDYKRDELAAMEDHMNKRKEITADGLAAERKEMERHESNVAKIRENMTSSLVKLQRSFDRQSADDQKQYMRRRADLLRDSNKELEENQKDLLERLRKMQLEHDMRVDELLAARDAVGLVRENQRFALEQQEAMREANIEASKRREDLAERLAELDRDFAEQKARRLEDFNERRKEIQEDAAIRMEEENKRHTAEMAEIKKQTQEKIQEEDRRYAEERRRAQLAFIQRIRDLDARLLGERDLQVRRHKEMILELDAFLAQYREKWAGLQTTLLKSVPTTTTTPTPGGRPGNRAFGGYATYGLYMLGDSRGGRGPDEFVLDGPTTRTAERIIGGRLSQRAILARMMGRTSVTWNDHRKFDSRISPEERQMIMNDNYELLNRLVN